MDVRSLRRNTSRSDELAEKGWYHSFELPDGSVFNGVQSLNHLRKRYADFPLPGDLTGKTVLDIGAWDGWFSFEAERRGALVTALDAVEIPNFLLIHDRLKSRVEYRIMDIYKIQSERLGPFDYVFFLGVLYHLKHPLLALEIVCSVTADVAIVESFVTDADDWQDRKGSLPSLEFYEFDELGGQSDNWFGPSVSALLALCRTAGFAGVELLSVEQSRAAVACYRRWKNIPATAISPAPRCIGVMNNHTGGINFTTSRDEYISWWFSSGESALTRDDIRPEVDGYGVRVTHLRNEADDVWMAVSRLPPGITPGWKRVRIGTANGGFAEYATIAVDIPAEAHEICVSGVCDGTTWEPSLFRVSRRNSCLCLWVNGLGQNADRSNVIASLNGMKLTTVYVGPPDESGVRQVNCIVKGAIDVGHASLTVQFGETRSPPVTVECS